MNTIHTTHKNAEVNFTTLSSRELMVTVEINNNKYVAFSIDFFVQDLKTATDDTSYWRVQVEHIDCCGDYYVEQTVQDLLVDSWEYDSDDLIDCVNALIAKTFQIEQQAEDNARTHRKHMHK